MAITRATTLRCDHEGCGATFTSNSGDEMYVRGEASAERGWVSLMATPPAPEPRSYFDFCRDHAVEASTILGSGVWRLRPAL